MNLFISEDIEKNATLSLRIKRASQMLEEAIGPRAELVNVNWDIVEDASGRPMVLLVLSDSTGARAETQFPTDMLANENRLQARFYTVWGDLLQDRSHRQLIRLSGGTDPGL